MYISRKNIVWCKIGCNDRDYQPAKTFLHPRWVVWIYTSKREHSYLRKQSMSEWYVWHWRILHTQEEEAEMFCQTGIIAIRPQVQVTRLHLRWDHIWAAQKSPYLTRCMCCVIALIFRTFLAGFLMCLSTWFWRVRFVVRRRRGVSHCRTKNSPSAVRRNTHTWWHLSSRRKSRDMNMFIIFISNPKGWMCLALSLHFVLRSHSQALNSLLTHNNPSNHHIFILHPPEPHTHYNPTMRFLTHTHL